MIKKLLSLIILVASPFVSATGVEISPSRLPEIVIKAAANAYNAECPVKQLLPMRAYYFLKPFVNEISLNVYTVMYPTFVIEVVTKDDLLTAKESVFYIKHDKIRCL